MLTSLLIYHSIHPSIYHDLSVIYVSSIYQLSTCDLAIICLPTTYDPSIHHLSVACVKHAWVDSDPPYTSATPQGLSSIPPLFAYHFFL